MQPTRASYPGAWFGIARRASADPDTDVGHDEFFAEIAEQVVEMTFIELQRLVGGPSQLVEEPTSAGLGGSRSAVTRRRRSGSLTGGNAFFRRSSARIISATVFVGCTSFRSSSRAARKL